MSFSIDQFRLDGKVAIVTGAGGRGNSIGRAYATGLACAGASVVVADLNLEGAQAVADEILSARPNIGYLTISNALQWRLQYSRVIQQAGMVNGIIRVK